MSRADEQTNEDLVLLTWLARNNDPFDRSSTDDEPIDGPTLTLLFDPASEFRGRVRDVVIFCRASDREPEHEERLVDRVRAQIGRRARGVTVHKVVWRADDPTDHAGILDFLRERMGGLRRQFEGRELIIHSSPGTPSMQTVWVLMAECGLIDPPFRVVKSYRRRERRGRPPVVPVALGIESYFKVYRAARVSAVDAEHDVLWDPQRFRSPALRALYARARQVARMRVPVLILGERGTGKTTLANWIRAVSPYRNPELDSAWPAVPCGQLAGETIRSELLGHRQGAFTGAHTDRAGLLARADGDTLFLDEIADLSLAVQRLLIRAVEEQRFTPLGADRPVVSRFRLLTATNQPLEVLRQRLDADFFDRITAFRLTVPPLRLIPEDIDWLWASAYSTARRRAGLAPADVALGDAGHAAIAERLRSHPLPGNVRDLLRVAWQIQAARLDGPIDGAEAGEVAEGALAELHSSPRQLAARSVARAWAEGAPLDDVLPAGEVFEAKATVGQLRQWLAEQLLDLARRRGVKSDEISDVSGKTLREWRKLD